MLLLCDGRICDVRDFLFEIKRDGKAKLYRRLYHTLDTRQATADKQKHTTDTQVEDHYFDEKRIRTLLEQFELEKALIAAYDPKFIASDESLPGF